MLKNQYQEWLSANLKIVELLIWLKGNFFDLGFHKHFRPQTEYALLIQKQPCKKEIKDRGIGQVFNEIVNFTNRHNPHQKPLHMTTTIIQQLTNEGDLVIDPCAGSFTTLRTDLTLRKLIKFNQNKERSRLLLRQEKPYLATNE